MNPKAYRLRQAIRLDVARDLPPTTRVLDLHAGAGEMYRAAWCRFEGGTCVLADADDAASAARMRPTWACFEGNGERFLSAGMAADVPFDVIDIDPGGEPWPCVHAWATSERVRAPVTHLIVGDAYRHKRNASAPSRTLVPRDDDAAVRRQARRAVEREIRAGTIARIETQPCKVCGERAQGWHHHDYAPVSWLAVTALCDDCHGAIHGGHIDDPTLGRRWQERPKLLLSEDGYDALVAERLAEWGAAAGLTFRELAHRSIPSLRVSAWTATRTEPAANAAQEER